jgi:uncharacterized protein YbjT (DUF2867 family)
MSAHENSKLITVLGATGNQGGGVVQALLKSTISSFHVRAITRDVTSNSATQLKARFPNDDRLELMQGNVYDRESLVKAFNGSHGVFAVTNNRLPGQRIETEKDMDHELEAGRNILDAAKVCMAHTYNESRKTNLTST